MQNPVITRKAAALQQTERKDEEKELVEEREEDLDLPASPQPAQAPPPTPSTSPDVIELHRRVSHLNRKITLMAQHPDMICPGEIINLSSSYACFSMQTQSHLNNQVYSRVRPQSAPWYRKLIVYIWQVHELSA